MARSSKSRAAAQAINWPLAVGIAGVAGVGAWYLMAHRVQAATPTPANPALNPPVPQPAPAPTPAPTGNVSSATVRSLQTALNAVSAGTSAHRCNHLTEDGVWGPNTTAVLQCWVALARGAGLSPNVPNTMSRMGETAALAVVNQVRSTMGQVRTFWSL